MRVNGKKVNIASYRVSEGDVIEVRDRSKQMAALLEATQLAERDVPDYIDADHSKMTATFVRTPRSWRRALSCDDGTEPRGGILREELIFARSSFKGRDGTPPRLFCLGLYVQFTLSCFSPQCCAVQVWRGIGGLKTAGNA